MKFILYFFIFLISFSVVAQDEDEAMIEEIEAQRAQQAAMANQIGQTSEQIQNKLIDFPGELKKLGHKTFDTMALGDEKVVNLARKMINQNSMSHLSLEQASQLILERSQGSLIHQFLKNRPKLVKALADVLISQQALSGLLGLFLRKEDLKLYSFIWFGSIVLAWALKKIFFNKNWGKLKTLFYSLLLSLMFSVLSITVFYQMFHQELSPTAKILWTHWQKRNL